MKLKKLLLVTILIFATSLLCGCADIEFIRAIDATNTIVDRLVIELDESKVNKSGKELDEVMSIINSDMITFRNSVYDWKLQFAEFPDYELLGDIDTGILVESTIHKRNQIILTIQFSNGKKYTSWDMFGLFYGYSKVDNFEYKAVMQDVGPFVDKIIAQEYTQENYGLFFIKYSILRNAGIVHSLQEFEYGGINYYEKYKELLNNHYDLNDINVAEIFAYPDDRLYSNADDGEVEGNMTFLRWELSDKDENFQMEIFKLYPNSIAWYILALIISAIVIVVLFIVIYIKSKKQIIQKITKKEVENEK